MMLWLAIALMTGVAILAVLWPLSRRAPASAGSDIEVYRDQLDEIERDRAAGLIGVAEAEAARVEVSRRLIAAADAAGAEAAPGPDAASNANWRRRAAAIAALIVLPLVGAGFYLPLGSPDRPGQSRTDVRELSPEQRSIAELIGRVEAHLEQNPDDGRGWEVLSPVYMRLGRFQDAVKARRNVLQLLGVTADRETDLGEALAAAANGVITAESKAAFERALRLDPADVRARFFMGHAAEQDGRPNDAADMWRKLLAEAPPGAPWVGIVRESLARVDPSSPAPRGPSAEDVAAAAELAPEQRAAMVQGMVERLAERLKQDGGDVEGWLRLMRAYMVMGDKAKAQAAAADARRALAGDAEKLRRVDELMKGLGLEG
ncbi:MAG: c-type cytochrome biogenesis protein CcmI [Alphaproteobacteria bacterium]|nr:c-type cytochrome biogenesis protein CcmI [Alphaproteobacteria bacterium]